MNRQRSLRKLLIHPILPWTVMAIMLALVVLLAEVIMEDRREHAQLQLTLHTQRLALDLAGAAQTANSATAAQALLKGGITTRIKTASVAVDDVTGLTRTPVYRSNPALDTGESAQSPWIHHVEVVPIAGRKWELRLAQPRQPLLAEGITRQHLMLGCLLALTLVFVLVWRMQRQTLKSSAHMGYDFLQKVIDALPTPVFVKDAEHRYLLLNKAFGRAFALDTDSLIGKSDLALHDAATAASRFAEDDRALATEQIVVTTQSDRDPTDRMRYWLKSKAALDLPEMGRGICGILTDVTAQHEAESQAHAAENFLQAVVDALPQPMYVKNEQFRWVLVNDAFARLMNRSKEELFNLSDADFWDADRVQSYQDHDRQVLESGGCVAKEEEVPLPGGEVSWLVTNKSALTISDGRKFVIGVIFDITAQHASAKALEHAHQFLRAIMDTLPHSLVVKDEAGHYLMVNKAWCEAVSIDSEKVLGRRSSDVFPAEIARRLEAQDAEAWATGGTVTTVQPRISLGGKAGWSLKSKRVVRLPNGQRYNVQVTTDVTAHQEALAQAQRSEALVRGLLDSIPNPIIVKDGKRRYLFVNAAASVLNSSGKMRAGSIDADLFPADICARYAAEDSAALADPSTRWYSDTRRDAQGNERWWVKSKRAITILEKEILIVSVLSDVTALKVAERDLVRNQARLRVLHDLAMLMLRQSSLSSLGRGACDVLIRSLEGRRVSYAEIADDGQLTVIYSSGAEDLPDRTNWRQDLSFMPELLHRFRHLDLVDAADLHALEFSDWWDEGRVAEETCATLFLPLTVGSRLAGMLLVDGAAHEPWAAHEMQLLRESIDHLRIACQTRQAESSRQAAEAALRDREADLRRHRDNLQVLVEERTRELKHAMQVAEAANQSKSQFFTTMSHELRTPMNSVISFAKLGLEKVRSGSLDTQTAQLYLERIDRSAGRLLLLINDLLDLAKLEAGRMTYRFGARDLRKVITTVCDELAAMAAASRVGFNIEYLSEQHMAWCDEVRMEQVMRNVLSNALRYSPEGGSITIRTTKSCIVTHEDEDQGTVEDAVEITVADQGPGIPADELDRIFDKYVQSSHTRKGGTGLGLPIAREILRQHRGSIFASNGMHAGAVMTITLPIAAPQGLPVATQFSDTPSA